MNLLRKFFRIVFDFYLYSNVHIALCAVALTLATQYIFHFRLRNELLIFIFCGTFFGYNIQRLPSAFQDVHIRRKFRRHHWNTQHRKLLAVISALAAGAAVWAYMQLIFRSQVVALIPAALSIAYAFPLLPARGKWKKLREIQGIKIFVIALVWAMSCALMPAAAADVPGEMWFSPAVLLWSLCCGLLIFALTIPFDIRDFHYDGEKLSTIPARVGIRNSIRIALAALFISALAMGVIYFIFHAGSLLQFIAYCSWTIITAIIISKSTPERHEYFFSFLIDGLIILLGGMIFVVSQF